MNPPTIYLLGAGAVGLSFGYFLRRAGLDVTVILRDEEKLKLFQQQNGFYCQIEQQTDFITCHAVLAKKLTHSIDYLIICTKAFDVLSALKSVKHLLNKNSKVMFCHNGLGVLEQIQALISDISVTFAVTTLGAYQKKSFDIKINGHGQVILENALFLDVFKMTDMDVYVASQFKHVAWQKFAVNSAINALTTIYRCMNGALLHSEQLKIIIQEITREIVDVAKIFEVQFDFDALCEKIFSVAAQTDTNYSSMLQDVTKQQITEIDYLNGYAVFLAKKYHKNVPYNVTLTNIIKRLHHDYS